MGVAKQVEGAVDRALDRRRGAVVAPGEELALPALALAAGHGRAAAVGDPGRPLAAVAAVGGQPGGHRAAGAVDPIGMEVERDPTGGAELRRPVLGPGFAPANGVGQTVQGVSPGPVGSALDRGDGPVPAFHTATVALEHRAGVS